MMYALNLSEDNRILSATFDQYGTPDQPRVEKLPEGNLPDYIYVDGEYVYEPLPEPEPPEPEPTGEAITADEMATAIMEGVNEV